MIVVYKKRATFEEFIKEGIPRSNDNIRYKIVRTHQEVEGLKTKILELTEDVIVRLGQDGSRFLSFKIRLIMAKSQVSG
ncbi:hypothetical protein IHO13_05125 [Wolbachia endosymbiont of Mansonella perstans]|nr:hypothetical protein [Wolbachia endosymbiont of Mansonella perstans]